MALSNALLDRNSDINTGLTSIATSVSLSAATDVSRIVVLSVYDDGFTGSIGFSGDGLTYTLVDDTTGITNGPSSPIVHRIYHANGSPTAGTLTCTFTSDTMDYAEMSVFQVSGSTGAVGYEGLLVPVTNGAELNAGNSYDFTMTTSAGATGNGLWAYAAAADDSDDWTVSRTGWSLTSAWDTATGLVFQAEAVAFSADEDTSCVFEKTATSAGQYAVGLVLEFSEGGGGGGSTQNMSAEATTATFSTTGISSVNFPATAEATTNVFSLNNSEISTAQASIANIASTLLWGVDVIDGDSLEIYIAGISTLDTTYALSSTNTSLDVLNISGEATYSATLSTVRTNFVLEQAAELLFGVQADLGSYVMSLGATAETGYSITASPSNVAAIRDAMINKGATFVTSSSQFVKGSIEDDVKKYS